MISPTPTDVEDAKDPLSTLFPVHGALSRTFAVPAARVMFVQINKNACTSLKWMMAGLAGEDLDGFTQDLMPFTSPQDAIHDRRQWKIPKLDALDPELRAQIHPDNGWFVFAVTRDPRSRLFSAWQSKLLLENPGYTSFQSQPWYPRHPLSAETVIEDFAKFVDLFEREPAHGIRGDGHFRDQIQMVYPDAVSYTEIYDIRELGRLQADLRRHLDSVGWSGELRLPKFNDTPLRANAQPFADGIRERVEKIYAADFERFGDRWDFAVIESAPAWTSADLNEAELQATFGHRIGDLRDRALKLRAKATAERERADAQATRADTQAARADKQKKRADTLQRQVSSLTAQSTWSDGGATSARPRLLRSLAGAVRRRLADQRHQR